MGTTVLIVSVLMFGVAAGLDGATLQDAAGNTRAGSSEASNRVGHGEPTSLGHGYSRRDGHVEFKGVRIDQAGRDTLERFERTLGRRLTPAGDVDAASFVALSEEYAKDKDTVYYKWISPGRFWVVEIQNADPATFEVMDLNLARDAKRVWRTDVPVEGADPATARVVNPGWVWKDRDTVYYQATRIPDADPATFRHLNKAFYRDARHVYWSSTRLRDADVDSFQTFGNDTPYAVDRRNVWFGETRIAGVNAASFRFFHNHVFADHAGVYVSGRALPIFEADAASFGKVAELASGGCVLFRDARREYLFDPSYIEVFTLTRSGGAIEITKPVWFGEAVGPVRHAATVSAIWKDGAMSEPAVGMRPGFEGSPRPTWEVGKMKRMSDAIRETLALPEKEPAAARDGEAPTLPQRGDR